MHGQFIWYDLLTSDAAAARKFYPAVLGWKSQVWEEDKAPSPEERYTLWTLRGVPLGGVARLSDGLRAQGVRPHWIPTVEVRDVDQTARLAQSLGAQIQFGPDEIPGTGRYATLTDPLGALFAIFTPARPTPAFDGTPEVGRFSWHELLTSDYRRAFEFYGQLLGWEKTSDFDMGGGNIYLMFGQNGKSYGGIYSQPPEMAQVAPYWLSYVNVKDVRKATAAAKKGGARLINGPMEVPGGDWIAAFTDPQGAAFAIHQRAAQPGEKGSRGGDSRAKKSSGSGAAVSGRSTAKKSSRRAGGSSRKSGSKRKAGARSPRAKPRAAARKRKRAKRR